jgi:hypothetical protein
METSTLWRWTANSVSVPGRWVEGAPRPSIEQVCKQHFQAVVDAASGWSAALAMIRLGTKFIIALGAIAGIASGIRQGLQVEWARLLSAVFVNWGVLSGIALVAFGCLLRWALRLCLRWKFGRSLSIGQAPSALP